MITGGSNISRIAVGLRQLSLTGNLGLADAAPVKRARSAYLVFSGEKFKDIKERNPRMEFTEISKQVSQDWKNLTERDRKRYTDIADKEKLKVSKAMEKLTDEEKDQMDKDRRVSLVQKKIKKLSLNDFQDLGMPNTTGYHRR